MAVSTLVDRLVEHARVPMDLNDVLALGCFKIEKIAQALEVPEGTLGPENCKSCEYRVAKERM